MLLTLRSIVDVETTVPVRIGVNRGHVFAGDIGPAYRRTYTVMGDAVNLAARVMSMAVPGQILATGPVLDASSVAFNAVALEPFMVKGKKDPVARVHGRTLDREQARDRVSGVPARRSRPGDGRVPAGVARAPGRAGLGARARRERRDGQDEAAERVPGRGARPPAPRRRRASCTSRRSLTSRSAGSCGSCWAAGPDATGVAAEVAGGRRPPRARAAALAAAARGRGRRRGPDDPRGPRPGGRVPPGEARRGDDRLPVPRGRRTRRSS